jgi:hypothetical protein
MKKLAVILLVLGMMAHTNVLASDVSDLENLTLSAESYWNGSDLEGSYSATDSFTTDTASFNNFYAYDADYMYSSWGGFAYSNITDTTATGFTAQYNAIPGSGQDDSRNYAIGYCNTFAAGQPMITFETPQAMTDAYFTNTNYAYDSMLNGDQFAKKFEAGDWFKLTITGKDEAGAETGNVEFLLADGTAIVNTWTRVDLSPLETVKTLEFALTSTDNIPGWGMNTPAYFAMDTLNTSADFENLALADESYWDGSGLDGSYTARDAFTSGIATYNNYYAYDADYMYSSWGGFAYSNITDTGATGFTSQYNAIVGSGHSSSRIYAVGYCNAFAPGPPTITFETARTVSAARITNTNYAYYSMLDGDGFAKKFGGDSGDDADWFLLTITGKDVDGNDTETVEFYLADFRFADNTQDYIIDDWTLVDLSSLGEIKSLEFALTSSDSDPVFGMNTPAYFAIDSINDFDDDGDGYSEVEGDCDDSNPDINPNATEICGDGIDQDCSGSDLICGDDDDNWLKGCFIGVSGEGWLF